MPWTHRAAAGVCVLDLARCLPTPCLHPATLWAPAMARDSYWAGLSMCPGRLWTEAAGAWQGGPCPGRFQRLGGLGTPMPGMWGAAAVFSWIPGIAFFWPLP